jgi:hypothetical protein
MCAAASSVFSRAAAAAVRNRAVVPGSILHLAARESNKAFTLYSIKPIQEKAMRCKKCL